MSQEKEAVRFEDGESVAVYCRVSTSKEDQVNSLENQKSYFANFAKKNNLTIYHIYYDEGLTGTSWVKRDGFNNLMKAAGIDVIKEIDRHTLKTKTSYSINKKRTPKFKKIVIKNTSRFARNILSIELIKMLRQNGVHIYFLDQDLVTTINNDFILKLFMTFDENDSRDKSIKVRFGFKEGARKGMIYLGGGKLFGYDYHPESNTLTKNADAKVVKLIFDMYTEERLGIRVIAKKLQEMGYKTAKGNSEWGKTTIRNILNNEKYAGKNPVQKFDAGIILEDKHWPKVREHYEVQDTDKIEPIISWEQFLKAKEIREGKTELYNGQRVGRKNVYSRYTKLVKCGVCGSTYIRNVDYKTKQKRAEDRYYFYNCSGKKKYGTTYCKNRNVLETTLDELIKNLSYTGLRDAVELRIVNYRWHLIRVAELYTTEIDDKKESEAAAFAAEIAAETETLTQMYKKLLVMDDTNGVIAGIIKEQEAKISGLKAQQEQAAEYNNTIIDIITALKEKYEEISELKGKLKNRYAEDEIISMLSCIVVDYHDWDNSYVLRPHFKIFDSAKELLDKYGERYHTNIDDWQHTKNTDPTGLEKATIKCYNNVTAFLLKQ